MSTIRKSITDALRPGGVMPWVKRDRPIIRLTDEDERRILESPAGSAPSIEVTTERYRSEAGEKPRARIKRLEACPVDHTTTGSHVQYPDGHREEIRF